VDLAHSAHSGSGNTYPTCIPWAPHQCYGGRDRVERELAAWIDKYANQLEAVAMYEGFMDGTYPWPENHPAELKERGRHIAEATIDVAREALADAESYVAMWANRLDALEAAGR
jgi:hypothetical protein